jgi:hypothetical protein
VNDAEMVSVDWQIGPVAVRNVTIRGAGHVGPFWSEYTASG